jgi:hypothetical protein
MTAPQYQGTRIAALIAVFCAAALLSPLHPHAVTKRYDLKDLANCTLEAFVNSAQRAELASLCWRAAMDAARSRIYACFLPLDVVKWPIGAPLDCRSQRL